MNAAIHFETEGREWVSHPWQETHPPLVGIAYRCEGPSCVTVENVHTGAVIWSLRNAEERAVAGRVKLPLDFGVYRARISSSEGANAAEAWLAVIPQGRPGPRPDSFFASNTSQLRRGRDLELIEAIGIRVQRVHVQNVGPVDLEEQRRHRTWILPIVGYADPLPMSEWAERFRQHGPPADFNAFVEWWEKKLLELGEVRVWEFWNEPWIFEWTWADTPAAYRRLQTQWARMARRVRPDIRILAGSSWMFVQDHIEPHPECWHGLLDGITHHPYSDTAAPTFRGGALQRSIDGGFLLCRRMGLRYYYLTEGGTNLGPPDHGGAHPDVPSPNNLVNARKIVQLFVMSALNGAFQANAQWGIGYGHGWTLPNAAVAHLTHWLEDRPIVAEIWPRSSLLRGAIFAHPRHVDDAVRALPRADELSARWEVPVPPDRDADETKVAVIWSWTGPTRDRQDQDGRLTLDDAADIRAYNLFGREIAREPDGRLTVPFTEEPVYLVTERLAVAEFHRRIAGARLTGLTPINLYVQPFSRPVTDPQSLVVRLDNPLNVDLQGDLVLHCLQAPPVRVSWRAASGTLTDVAIPWPGGLTPRADNRYPVWVDVQIHDEHGNPLQTLRHRQAVPVARIVRRTVRIDGDDTDWRDLPAVRIAVAPREDLDLLLRNPTLTGPEDGTPEARDAADLRAGFEVRCAYDETHLYFAIHGLGVRTRIGAPWHEGLPWKTGVSDGLGFPHYVADAVQIGLGFRFRVPGHGRQPGDPWVWRGLFYDTDHLFVIHPTLDRGDQVIRLWGSNTDRRIAYQIEAPAHVGPVPGAVAVLRAGFWEFAVPRSEVPEFDPRLGSVRLGVLINGRHNLSESVGVFDYWHNAGSFAPSWEFHLPAQVTWGIDP